MQEPVPSRTTLAEFEVLLAASEPKLELLEGEVVAFAVGSIAHGILCSRLHAAISAATKPPYEVFTSDVAVRFSNRATYVFPDVSQTREQLDLGARFITAPDLVVEVISLESEARDRGEKLDAYQSIPSVMEYLLVDSRRTWVCLFRRMAGAVWTETTYGLGEVVDLRTVGVTLSIDELYAGTGRVLSTERAEKTMASDLRPPEMSLHGFLRWESTATTRHEFVNGHIYAIAGASRAHGTIAVNLAALIRPAIRKKSGSRAYLAEMKVVPPAQRSVRYPDLVLTCDERDFADEQIARFPKLIVEVLSRSTAALDRGEKFEDYRRIPTLDEYIVIDSTQVLVEVYRRAGEGWAFRDYGPGETFCFESVPLTVNVAELYEDVELGRLEQRVIDSSA